MTSLLCFCTHPVESSEHLFFCCPFADSVLSWVQSLMFSASPLCPNLLLRHLLFGFSEDELLCLPRFFVYLLGVCKFFICCARNDFWFRDVRPSAIDVIESVKARVHFYLPLFFWWVSVQSPPVVFCSSLGCPWGRGLYCGFPFGCSPLVPGPFCCVSACQSECVVLLSFRF